jgi:hypothetical protein
VPLFFARAGGARLYDVDGNAYVDYVLGVGPAIPGHAPPVVTAAVAAALGGGQLFAGQHRGEVELARRVQELVPCAELADFDVRRGDACVAGAWWDARRAEGLEPVGTLRAGATPNGPVAREAYERLKGELLERLGRALPEDGVYLDLHGAMEVAGLGDGESHLVAGVRGLVGRGVPVAASLDLHANLAPTTVGAADVLTAYRTAPHQARATDRPPAGVAVVDRGAVRVFRAAPRQRGHHLRDAWLPAGNIPRASLLL